MSKARCFVEIDPATGLAIRILKNKAAYGMPEEIVRQIPRIEAVGQIRHQVWLRSGGWCENGCGRRFVEHGPLGKRMEMDERISKGRCGEVSVSNGWGLCHTCHENKTGVLQFGCTNLDKEKK